MRLDEAKKILQNNGFILENADDDEYQLYLKLKKKFEGSDKKDNKVSPVNIGDIFVNVYQWEYARHETFYKVVDYTNSSLKLAQLESEMVKQGGIGRPAEYRPLNKIDKNGETITKRYKVDDVTGSIEIKGDKTHYWYKYRG